jgi:peptidoglycan/xylan/chitin deacetylase (PgdA/CDA1 family)
MSDRAAVGSMCVSIDLELAWGVWDHVTPDDLSRAESAERPIVRRLLELGERYDIAMTWATVGRVFDEQAPPDGLPGPRAAWFAPELVEAIQRSRVAHDIGSHSWSHVYFGGLTAAAARAELERDMALRKRWGITTRSWVYPRNDVGHIGLLAEHGVRVYRTHDAGLLDVVRHRLPRAYPAANLLEKVLPVVPPTVVAGPADPRMANIVALPSSTLLLGRNGARRLVRPQVTAWRWKRALDNAAREGRVFHPWFHPSNFYFDGDAQFEALDAVFGYAAKLRDAGRLRIRTMADFAVEESAR